MSEGCCRRENVCKMHESLGNSKYHISPQETSAVSNYTSRREAVLVGPPHA
jgi:hypothetical protein